MTLMPLLKLFCTGVIVGIRCRRDAPGGGFCTVWLAHTIFALPLAVFLLHNFISEIPGELIEAARVDGAGHAKIFRRIVLPLITPAWRRSASSSSSGSGTTCWSR